MIHTERCNAEFEMHDKLVAEYKKMFPNYCRKCQGWGGRWERYDPSPSGISLSPGYMEEFEMCPDCADSGKCPRCGTLACLPNEEDQSVCAGCGFTVGEDDGMPIEPQCYCWAMPRKEDE